MMNLYIASLILLSQQHVGNGKGMFYEMPRWDNKKKVELKIVEIKR